ncbi:MAG: hypothetical protein LBR21_06910 [Propionibacteriaceae bacterium]|jgi:hypothetical protein|nr:hypothetical protein [Propionibacteriaceae bacterium]
MGLFDWLGTGTEEPEPVEPVVTPAPTAEQLQGQLDKIEETMKRPDVPTPVKARVRKITGTLRLILPRLENLGLGSYDAYAAMATATDYLPEALRSYLRLPRQWADTRPVAGMKTSLMLLVEQLDLLDATTRNLLDAVSARDAQALYVNGAFLQEKFRTEEP